MVGSAGELLLVSAFGRQLPAVSTVLFNSCVTLGVLEEDELTNGLLADDGTVNALITGVTDALLAEVDAFAALVATSRVGLVPRVTAAESLLPATTELVTTSTLGVSVGLDVTAAVIGLLFAAGRLFVVVVVAVPTAGELLEFELVVAVAADAVVVSTLSGSFLIKSLLASGVSEDIVHFSRLASSSSSFGF